MITSKLTAASEHLRYEVWMLRCTNELLATRTFADQRAVQNALIESYAVHARILLDFLCLKSSRHDDVLAVHFFSDTKKWNASNGIVQRLTNVNRRVGKEIVHLTYSRQHVTPEDKRWPFPAMTAALNEGLHAFAVAADLLDGPVRAYLLRTEP